MRISLRLKLALISLLLLVIPYSGMRLSSIVKSSLLESRQESLLFSARAVASALSGRKGLFDQEQFHSLDQRRDLYLYQLTNPMRLNGKKDDWLPHINSAEYFGLEHVLVSPENFSSDSSGFHHQIGRRGDYLYAIFLVRDDTIVYRQHNSLALDRSDHLQIAVEDPQGNLNRYLVAADKPGWINGYIISRDFENILPARSEPRIQGVLEPTGDGYVLEIRIPLRMVGNRLAFAIADVDNRHSGEIQTVIGTASIDNPEKIGWLLEQSQNIENILESLNRPQSKIQIVDTNQHIRASFGSLNNESKKKENGEESILARVNSFLTPIYQLFTNTFSADFLDTKPQPSTLDIQGVKEALTGRSSISSYRIAGGEVEIMAAITPLYENDVIVGAVVVEQTTNSILALQNKVIQESIGLTLLVLIFGGLGLLFFAFRISSRIRQLRDQASHALGENGQILTVAPPAKAKDEIGDLSSTLYTLLTQLKAQSQYREKMADNLEHEMRTPLASVSASLKNLASELSGQPELVQGYVNWALGDIKRMEDLLTSIRDATSLTRALQQDQKELFNLSEAISMWMKLSWQEAFTNTNFIYRKPERDLYIEGDPDRIRQMLDKLIENSVEFHTPKTAIELHLQSDSNYITIKVMNEGPEIPQKMLEEIFNSMVSARFSGDAKPHLGLGLFIVRTIAQHHGGAVSAQNLDSTKEGVIFTVRLPRQNLQSLK